MVLRCSYNVRREKTCGAKLGRDDKKTHEPGERSGQESDNSIQRERERVMRWLHRKSVQQRNRQGVGVRVSENVRDQTHRSYRTE